MARIEDLRKLDDNPIERQVEALEATHARRDPHDHPDARDQPWSQFVDTIDALLASGDARWAHDTLTGIRETVARTQRVTEGQQRALDNIDTATREPRRDGRRRRYESWTR